MQDSSLLKWFCLTYGNFWLLGGIVTEVLSLGSKLAQYTECFVHSGDWHRIPVLEIS